MCDVRGWLESSAAQRTKEGRQLTGSPDDPIAALDPAEDPARVGGTLDVLEVLDQDVQFAGRRARSGDAEAGVEDVGCLCRVADQRRDGPGACEEEGEEL